MFNSYRFVLALFFLCPLFILGCKKSPEQKHQPAKVLTQGENAPEIRVSEWLNARETPELKGKTVILEFWATWCGPCKLVIPHMNELVDSFSSPEVVFVSMTNEKKDVVTEFMKSSPMKAFVALDEGAATSRSFGVERIPHAFIIDPQGIIRWHNHPMYITGEALRTYLATGETPKIVEPAGSVVPGSLTGVLGLNWGDPPEKVKRTLLAIKGVTFAKDSAGMRFRGGSFMGKKVNNWIVDCYLAKYLSDFTMIFESDSKTIDSDLKYMQAKLEKVYGKASGPGTWTFAVKGRGPRNSVIIDKNETASLVIQFWGLGTLDSLLNGNM